MSVARPTRRTGQTLTCLQCGKGFYRRASAVASKPSRWCSRQCADLGRRRGEARQCDRCGAAFYVYPSHLGKEGRVNRYCSRDCGNAASGPSRAGLKRSNETRARISKARAGVPIPKLRKPPIIHLCESCGGPFEVSRSRPTPLLAKFCSTDCWYRHVRLHPDASGTYRGGFEPYYGPDWASQAKKARERDNHTCQDCGLRQFNPRLDVHHLVPRRAFNGDYRAANALDNLVALCKACHARRERRMDERFTPSV